MEREIFWGNEPASLFTKSNWTRFVPTDMMTVPEALNAAVRFTVYFSALMAMVTGETHYLLFIPVVMVATVILVTLFPKTQVLKETFQSNGLTATPTQNNPFMNVQLTDYKDDPKRKPAPSDITTPALDASIEEAFSKTNELFMDTTDAFTLKQSARQFTTLAATTIPNNLEGYQAFLNKDNVSQKLPSEGYVLAKGSTLSGNPGDYINGQ
jgi:hypothetical protein